MAGYAGIYRVGVPTKFMLSFWRLKFLLLFYLFRKVKTSILNIDTKLQTKSNLSFWAMSHHYQCWTQLQDHSYFYQFQSEVILILPLVLYSFDSSWNILTFLLSSSSLCLLQNKKHTELLFPFPAEPSLQVQKLSICSLLQFHHPSHLCCPSLPHLFTSSPSCASPQNLSALMCSFTPSLPVQARHHLSLPPDTLYFHCLKLFSSKTTQNPSQFAFV